MYGLDHIFVILSLYLGMRRIKIGIGVICWVVFCVFFHNLLVLANYFFALFLHELAHLCVAIRRGYRLKLFRIDLFGMSIDIDSNIDSRDCFAVHIAGPLINLLLCTFSVVLYTTIPCLYAYLHIFAIANMSLAIFNLLPIYPLDGGKIFRGMVSDDEIFYRIDRAVRLLFLTMSILMAICSMFHVINWFCVLFIIFLVQTRKHNYSIINRRVDKIVIYKLQDDVDLNYSLHLIKADVYGLFYLGDKCIAEDKIYKMAMQYPLNSKLRDLICKN